MHGKGPSLFARLISSPKTSPVSGKSVATAIPPIHGRKTGFRKKHGARSDGVVELCRNGKRRRHPSCPLPLTTAPCFLAPCMRALRPAIYIVVLPQICHAGR